jgi:hypothetical protein
MSQKLEHEANYMRKSKVAFATFFVALLVNMASLPMTVHASTYSANAVWIQDSNWRARYQIVPL